MPKDHPEHKPAHRTEVINDRVVLHCDCGMSYKLKSNVDYAAKPVRCRRCLRVYKRLADGSFRLQPQRANEKQMTRLGEVLPPGKLDSLMGLSGLMEDPGDSMHKMFELMRAGGFVPTSPSRQAVDHVRQVWRVIKQSHGDSLDQEMAFKMDKAIDWLDAEAT